MIITNKIIIFIYIWKINQIQIQILWKNTENWEWLARDRSGSPC